jgi:hypothetical protein
MKLQNHVTPEPGAIRFYVDKETACVYSINLSNRVSTSAMLPRWKQNKPRTMSVSRTGVYTRHMCYTASASRPESLPNTAVQIRSYPVTGH